MRRTLITAVAAILLFQFVLLGAIVHAQGPPAGGPGAGSQTVITKAVADVTDPIMPFITIDGMGFGTVPVVRLGQNFGTLVELTPLITAMDTLITAPLPVTITPGTYLLVVEAGPGASQTGIMDVTIDAVGNELNTSLVLNGTDLELTDAGGTLSTSLSALVPDADDDPTNELNSAFTLSGSTLNLTLTDAGGILSADLSSLTPAGQSCPGGQFVVGFDATGDIICGSPTGVDKPVLLLRFDGSDGDTSTTNAGSNTGTITFNGTAQLDAAQSKFGGSSLLLD